MSHADGAGLRARRRAGLGPARTWWPGLSEGEISFDKLRAVADMATPETDRRGARAGPGVLGPRSWPTWPSGGRRQRRGQRARGSRRAVRPLQRPPPHGDGPAARPSPTPRSGRASRPGPARSPPTARRRGTSGCATPCWRRSGRRAAARRRQPVPRRGPRAAGRADRRVGRDDRPGRRARDGRPDQLRDGAADRL